MASGTLALGNRGMRYHFAEFLFFVASPAKVGTDCEEELTRLGLVRVRLGMTGDTTACLYYRMEILPRHLVLVAGHADRRISRMGIAGSPDD